MKMLESDNYIWWESDSWIMFIDFKPNFTTVQQI